MNTEDSTPPDVRSFFASVNAMAKADKEAADRGLAALDRIVPQVCYHDNGQAVVVTSWLASTYNGSDSPPVRLDDINRLDHELRVDLLAVVGGCGRAHFSDYKIREAFDRFGGQKAVDWFHSHPFLSDAPKAEAVLADRASSFWLKECLTSALKRDPVDAANDAEVLFDVLDARVRTL